MSALGKQSSRASITNTLSQTKVPYGYCYCLCGRKTNISSYSSKTLGYTKGEPRPYLHGHNTRHRRLPSRITIIEGRRCRTVPLTYGMEAYVSIKDYSKIKSYSWHVMKSGGRKSGHRIIYYAVTTIRGRQITMHGLIMGAYANIEYDHWNGNGLDNRRCNLRLATHSENIGNLRKTSGCSSRYKGVTWYHWGRKDGCWLAQIGGKPHVCLGYFDNERVAARAYDKAARKRFGKFASLNFPKRGERSALTGGIRKRI